MSNVVECEIRELVAEVTINRPDQLNALNEDVLNGLSEVLQQLAGESLEHCRVVILRGAGEKAFVAGADIKLMQQASPEELRAFISLGQKVTRQFESLPMPVIAVVDGFALGGGMEMALAADLIVATKKAKFGQPEVNLGLIPGFGGTQRLRFRCGDGVARRLILTGETISADEAHSLHLVDYLVEPEELDSQLSGIKKTLLSKGPHALSASKRAIQSSYAQALEAGLLAEVDLFLSLFAHTDTQEGLSAFIEKRKAEFTGK